jgi:tetratricopeptide (TPR) repeat protein
VWDSTGKQLYELKGHLNSVRSASFSLDGKWVVTASWDNTARVWDTARVSDSTSNVWYSTDHQLYKLEHQVNVWSASFSPDGKWVVTGSSNNTARVWRVYSLDELQERGCNWLNDYLVTHPKDLEKLEMCQTQSNRLEAAPFLVKEGEEEARGGNVDGAIVTFRTALKWNSGLPLNPETKAQQLAKASDLVKKGELLAEEGNIEAAVAEFQKALPLDPDFKPAPVLVRKGEGLVKEGKVKEAIAAYAQAQKFDPKFDIYAEYWNTLCQYGSLHRHAKDVLLDCEKAVALAPYNERYRDSRGIARALTGNTKGAIQDFQAYIKWIDNLPSGRKDFYKEEKSQRQRWVDALKAGNNPFTDEELKRLLGK